jgi:hypothetical protein
MVKTPWRRNPVENGIEYKKEMVLNTCFHFYCSIACLRNSKDIAQYLHLATRRKFGVMLSISPVFRAAVFM